MPCPFLVRASPHYPSWGFETLARTSFLYRCAAQSATNSAVPAVEFALGGRRRGGCAVRRTRGGGHRSYRASAVRRRSRRPRVRGGEAQTGWRIRAPYRTVQSFPCHSSSSRRMGPPSGSLLRRLYGRVVAVFACDGEYAVFGGDFPRHGSLELQPFGLGQVAHENRILFMDKVLLQEFLENCGPPGGDVVADDDEHGAAPILARRTG